MYRTDRGLFLLLRSFDDYDSIHGGTGDISHLFSRRFTIGRFLISPVGGGGEGNANCDRKVIVRPREINEFPGIEGGVLIEPFMHFRARARIR